MITRTNSSGSTSVGSTSRIVTSNLSGGVGTIWGRRSNGNEFEPEASVLAV